MKLMIRVKAVHAVAMLLCIVCFGLTVADSALAQTAARILPGTLSTNISMLLSDPMSNTIYAADSGNRRLLIINSERESVSSIQMNAAIRDMSFSKNNAQFLALATSAGVYAIDLSADINRTAPRLITLPSVLASKSIASVAFDSSNNLLLSTTSGWDSIYRVNFTTGALIGQFGTFYSGALLKTNATGTIVYIGERGLSPATIYRYVLGSTTVTSGIATPFNTIGSNLRDFSVSPVSDELFAAAGFPYSITRINATNLLVTGSFATGPYPAAVDTSFNYRVYATPNDPYNRKLYQFNVAQGTSTSYSLAAIPNFQYSESQARGVAVSKDGSKVYTVVGYPYSASPNSAIEVVSTGARICQ